MSDAFWNNLPAIIAAVAAAAVLWVQNRRLDRKSEDRVRQLGQQVADVKSAAVTTSEQAALMAKGAERAGVETGIDIGVEKERRRASEPAPLASFRADDTVEFMAGTDGSKSNNR